MAQETLNFNNYSFENPTRDPLFFWWRDRLRLRFTFLNRYSQKFIELEKQKGLMLILMLM